VGDVCVWINGGAEPVDFFVLRGEPRESLGSKVGEFFDRRIRLR